MPLIYLQLLIWNQIFMRLTLEHKNEKISAEYFSYRYNTRWYAVPVKIQKLFLFIMQNTTKVYILNIGNLIMASVEGFTKVRNIQWN